MKCDVDLMLEYARGSLDAAAAAKLESHIAGCPECSRNLQTFKALAELKGAYEVEVPEEWDDRARRGMEAAFGARRSFAAGRAAESGPVWRRGWFIGLSALAACLMLALAPLYLLTRPKPSAVLGTVVSVREIVNLVRGGEAIGALPHTPVLAGDLLRTADNGGAEVRYCDGSVAALKGGTEVGFFERGGIRIVDVKSGMVSLAVVPQSAAGGLTVLTPNSEIRVKGTRFTVAVQFGHTSVEVDEGRVEVSRRADSNSALLEAGQSVVVEQDGPLAAGITTDRRIRMLPEWGTISGLAARPGEIWLCDKNDAMLTVLDTVTGKLVRRVCIRDVCVEPTALEWDKGLLWIVDGNSRILALDAELNLKQSLVLPDDVSDVRDICIAGTRLWGTCCRSTLFELDLQTGRIVRKLDMEGKTSNWMHGIEYFDDSLWLCSGHESLCRIEPVSGSVLSRHKTWLLTFMAFDHAHRFWGAAKDGDCIFSFRTEALGRFDVR